MEIRSLDMPDFDALFSLVSAVYDDTPLSMWFEKKPEKESFRPIFGGKLEGMVRKDVVDIVGVGNDGIIGECEIARRSGEIGILGLLVLKEWRRRGVGSELLSSAIERAVSVGIYKLRAEIAEENSPAVVFLSKKGFSMNGSAARQTPDGIKPILLMLKEL